VARHLQLSLILGALLVAAQNAALAATATPEIWFFMRGYTANPDPTKNHGIDGQQGWRKLFLEPDAPWLPFMDHVQVIALAGGGHCDYTGRCLCENFRKAQGKERQICD
jgi:hypothetical protein